MRAVQPIFIDYRSERLFCVFREPDTSVFAKGSVILLPAFAEEMNRTRSFVSVVAAELADNGFYVLQPDLSGTGDSSGDFSNSTWTDWVLELKYLIQWLSKKCQPLNIVTVRTGALFLPELLDNAQVAFEKVCIIEPFISGQDYISLFLQQRVARSIFEGTKETAALLTEQLEKGGTLEIGGYELSTKMYESFRRSTLETLDAVLPEKTIVINCGRSQDSRRNNDVKTLVDAWNERGAAVEHQFIMTDPFWSQELPTSPRAVTEEIVKFLVRKI